MKTERLFEITAYSENQVGLLSSVAGIFTRLSLNIEKLHVEASKIPGVHKFVIQTRTTEDRIKPVVLQLEKKVDVLKAFYYVNEEHNRKEVEVVSAFISEREKENNVKK